MARFRVSPGLGLGAVAILSSIVLLSGASASAETGKGTLIVTLSGPVMDGAPTDAYRTYFIRAKRVDGSGETQIRWEDSWVVKSPNDLAASGGKGAVMTKELDAGDWEVHTYEVEAHGGIRLRPAKEISIPFKIQAGRATYIGDIQPEGHMTKGILGASMVGGARLVITDQSARDIPIAKAKKPDLGPVDVSVFGVDTLNNPLLSSRAGSTPAPGDEQFCRWMNLLGCVSYP